MPAGDHGGSFDQCRAAHTLHCLRGSAVVPERRGVTSRVALRRKGGRVTVSRRRLRAAHRKDVDQSCPRDPPGSARAALGVRVRRHAVDASTGVPRPRPTGGGRVPATCSKFHPYSRNPAPTRSASAQNRKRNHPLPSFLDTSRLDGVKPPRHRGAPRYGGRRRSTYPPARPTDATKTRRAATPVVLELILKRS